MNTLLTGLALFFILFALAAGPVSGSEEGGLPAKAGNYKIGVGDLLQIEVYDEPDLSVEVRVLTDGLISVPLIGAVAARGLTVTEFESKLTKLLGEKYLVDPHVTVIVKEFSNVYVFGEVKNPGAFPLTGKMTVFEAVTLAGGFTEVANRSGVKVNRQKDGAETTYQLDIERLAKKGDTSQDMELESNDRVIVPRSFF
jgi:polysaccharide export outer membrane protein